MKQLGVIEPSSSEWSSPIVLVPKKDGTLGFCLDFRKLNSVSKFDPYPMPRVDELVERLGRANYLSTQYLGFVLGHGVIRPQVGKVEAIKAAGWPETKKQFRAFLGLVGWYRKFIPNFSTRAITLTNLTKNTQPNKLVWTEDCENEWEYTTPNKKKLGQYGKRK